MRFHRGIAVPATAAEQIVDEIRRHGLSAAQGRWTMLAADLKPHLDELWQRPTLMVEDTDSAGPDLAWVCACADEAGATYYAVTHNRSVEDDTPLLITFDADIRNVIVDGRDFLYTLFQLGDPPRAGPVAEQLFGSAIRRYVDRAWSTNDQRQRIALCRLAVQDDAVIAAHAKNATVIGGRYRTRFCSAFLVRAPIVAERIRNVSQLDYRAPVPEPQLTLEMIRLAPKS